MKFGLVPGAFKPLHAGHFQLIEIAAHECDQVTVFVSLSDRDAVKGATMGRVWHDLIEPALPDNVTINYGGSPVRKIYEVLGAANKNDSDDTFVIYSDPDDLKANYSTLSKYAGNLTKNKQVILRPVSRSETTNVSGTQMRQWLTADDKKQFMAHLPKQIDRTKMWSMLRADLPSKSSATHVEGLLRDYVRLFVDR